MSEEDGRTGGREEEDGADTELKTKNPTRQCGELSIYIYIYMFI